MGLVKDDAVISQWQLRMAKCKCLISFRRRRMILDAFNNNNDLFISGSFDSYIHIYRLTNTRCYFIRLTIATQFIYPMNRYYTLIKKIIILLKISIVIINIINRVFHYFSCVYGNLAGEGKHRKEWKSVVQAFAQLWDQ